MEKVKKYWMPVVAGLCVISGLGDFNLTMILLGVGFGYVWWKDVRDSYVIDKKAITFKILRWMLIGAGLDMLFHGSVVEGVVVIAFVIAWIKDFFGFKFSKKFLSRSSTSSKKTKKSKSDLEERCNELLQCFWRRGTTVLGNSTVAGYALWYAHSIKRIEVFPYYVARVRMRSAKDGKWNESVESWSDGDVPKVIMPKLYISVNRFKDKGCEQLYHSESNLIVPDDKIVYSAEASRFPKLKELYEKVFHDSTSEQLIYTSQQEADVIRVEGIAKVVIHSDAEKGGTGAGENAVCWMNMATEELLDVALEDERPDSWYEENSLTESRNSPYAFLDRVKRTRDGDHPTRDQLIECAYKLGNPVATLEYGTGLYEGKILSYGKVDKSRGLSVLREAEELGMPRSKYLDESK